MRTDKTSAEQLRSMVKVLVRRHTILHAIRFFFRRRDFLEVPTPVRIRVPAMELHIDAVPSGTQYLRTSPELHMKRMLAAGYRRIFQIGPCFRAGEKGQLHNPEFTLLEWYRAEADYVSILEETRELFCAIAQAVSGEPVITFRGQRILLKTEWLQIPVWEAFQRWADWDPFTAFDSERFDLDMAQKIEPNLPRDQAVVLIDYPAPVAALARCKPDQPQVAERWELYLGGMELANAFSELVDPREQRGRFLACAEGRRAAGKAAYALDEEFLQALEDGMPPCGGIAVGIDRLVMAFTDTQSLADVIPFLEE